MTGLDVASCIPGHDATCWLAGLTLMLHLAAAATAAMVLRGSELHALRPHLS